MKWRQKLYLLSAVLFPFISLLSQTKQNVEPVIINKIEDARYIAVSPGGIIYVFEKKRNAILKYSPTGESLATVSGFGLSKNSFAEPTDMCSPNDLDLFLSDFSNHQIIQYDQSLSVTAIWRASYQYSSRDNLYRYPKSIDVDNLGKLYLIDADNKRIMKISSSQKVERMFGGFDAGKGRLQNPKRIRINNKGNIFVHDSDRIIVYDQLGNYISTIANDSIKSMQSFCNFENDLIVMDSCKIVRMRNDGLILSTIRISTVEGLNDLNKPLDITYRNKMLYFLSPNKVIGLPINSLFK
ncbi:MAG: hypothetical protein C0417_01195 [Chlorobiaceae bacterium]|nr:hypothetical protein [Chlorobiaceae bacterium]